MYHAAFKSVAIGENLTWHKPGSGNSADLMTNVLSDSKCQYLVCSVQSHAWNLWQQLTPLPSKWVCMYTSVWSSIKSKTGKMIWNIGGVSMEVSSMRHRNETLKQAGIWTTKLSFQCYRNHNTNAAHNFYLGSDKCKYKTSTGSWPISSNNLTYQLSKISYDAFESYMKQIESLALKFSICMKTLSLFHKSIET